MSRLALAIAVGLTAFTLLLVGAVVIQFFGNAPPSPVFGPNMAVQGAVTPTGRKTALTAGQFGQAGQPADLTLGRSANPGSAR